MTTHPTTYRGLRVARMNEITKHNYTCVRCGKPATHAYRLMTRILFLCLKHEDDLISVVYEKWEIDAYKKELA